MFEGGLQFFLMIALQQKMYSWETQKSGNFALMEWVFCTLVFGVLGVRCNLVEHHRLVCRAITSMKKGSHLHSFNWRQNSFVYSIYIEHDFSMLWILSGFTNDQRRNEENVNSFERFMIFLAVNKYLDVMEHMSFFLGY